MRLSIPCGAMWIAMLIGVASLGFVANCLATEPDLRKSLLVEAAEDADAVQVKTLLAGGADVSQTQPDGMTALHWAVFHRQPKLVELLLKHGAEVDAQTRYGVRPLGIACQIGDAACTQTLLAAGAEADFQLQGGESPLMIAARTGRPKVVQLLIDSGVDLDHRDKKKQTAIMWAAAEGNADVVEQLIEAGAKFEEPLSTGFTPMLLAVREGQSDVVLCLLKHGVDVNYAMNPDNTGGRNPRRGMMALHLAIENGHFELANVLLEAGADSNNQRGGYTPLHYLSWVRKPNRGDSIDGNPAPIGSGNMTSLELVEKLVEHGADVNLQLKRGSSGRGRMKEEGATPFLFAARRNDIPFMQKLLELGADPTIPNADNCTALLVAAGIGTYAPGEEAGTPEEALEAVKLLLSLGADINHVDDNGETAMHGATYKSLPNMVEFLANNGADITVWNRENKYGWTPTLIAEGHRPGNFKPAAETLQAVYRQLRAAGVEPPPLTPPKHRPGYEQ